MSEKKQEPQKVPSWEKKKPKAQTHYLGPSVYTKILKHPYFCSAKGARQEGVQFLTL